MEAEITFSGVSEFENFILLLQLVFELERFELRLAFQFLSLGTCITRPIAPKVCTNFVPNALHLSSEFQVSTFRRFEVKAISASGYRKLLILREKNKTKRLPTLSVAEVLKMSLLLTPRNHLVYAVIR